MNDIRRTIHWSACLPLALLALLLSASKGAGADKPFLTFNGATVATQDEFEHMYAENSASALLPLSKGDYVPLFINYKLKVAEARRLRLDTARAYTDECEYYIGELERGYLEDTAAQGRFERRLYERLGEEIHAEHVLVSCTPGASPADTANAYQRCLLARQRVTDGERFAAVASQMSEDPSASYNQGDLGWFSAMQMVASFEDAAYGTPVGQCSPVFRSRFGYHFMHVVDRRPAAGEVLLRHLFKSVPREATAAQQDSLQALADSLSAALKRRPGDFALAAVGYSDEHMSALRGGLTTWCTRTQMPDMLAEAAFRLPKDSVSDPIRSAAGWHILQVEDRRDKRPWPEFHLMVQRLFDTSPAFQDTPLRDRMSQLAKQYHFQWQRPGRDSLVAICLATPNPLERAERLRGLRLTLATIDGHAFSCEQAATYANSYKPDAIPSDNLLRLRDNLLRDYETERLPTKYPEYSRMRQEYEEGLLVFDYMQRFVWSLEPDSATVESMYAANTRRYSTGGVFEGSIYFCPSPSVAAKVRSLLSAGKTDKARQAATQVVDGKREQGGTYDDVLWPAAGCEEHSAVVSGAFTEGKPAGALDKRGVIVGDYQRAREEQMMQGLKARYMPKVVGKVK